MRTEPATRRSLAEWLQDAYAGDTGCPPPEAYLEAAQGIVSEARQAELAAHADSCRACAAERDLAADFVAEGAATPAATEDPVSPDDLDYVVSRLESRFGSQTPPTTARRRLLHFPKPGRIRFRHLAQIAAAVVLVIGIGSVIRSLGPTAPALPTDGPGEVVRGTSIVGTMPSGDLDRLPTRLEWQPTAGATAYDVRLTTVAGALLVQGRTSKAQFELPESVLGRLQPNTVYIWQVEAVDGNDSLLAWSGPVEFRIE